MILKNYINLFITKKKIKKIKIYNKSHFFYPFLQNLQNLHQKMQTNFFLLHCTINIVLFKDDRKWIRPPSLTWCKLINFSILFLADTFFAQPNRNEPQLTTVDLINGHYHTLLDGYEHVPLPLWHLIMALSRDTCGHWPRSGVVDALIGALYLDASPRQINDD